MTDTEKREAARQFYQKWTGRGREDEDDRSYWFEFLQMLGVNNITDRIDFQKKVMGKDKTTKRIDAYIPETKVLIEQKSFGIALDKPQSGHNGMTPYEQAKDYDNYLPQSEKAKWIVLSNFAEIWVYDMDTKYPEPVKYTLEEIPSKLRAFEFMVNKEEKVLSQEMEVSIKAGEFVGLIYDALLKQYIDPTSERSQKSLNKLCVRIVFCLYAEDALIFGGSGHIFHNYLERFSPADIRRALLDLFRILDTPVEKRNPYESQDLLAFPYVNGGLFADEDIEIPNFTDELKDIILRKASAGFDWSKISPTIFGAVFESTLNPETRRSGGMHYTSIENIHKVIDPLFLDDLKNELAEIKGIQVLKTRNPKLKAYQEKLSKLKWLDPACGSGNFLTETYISVRRLENEAIALLKGGQMEMVFDIKSSPIKVSIEQFYGIEINDFAVTVAKTALWIAESQMMKETEDILMMHLEFLPLKTKACIVEGNALRMDWSHLHLGDPQSTLKAKKINLISEEDLDPNIPTFVAEPGYEYDEINVIVDEIHMGKPVKDYPEIYYDYIMGNPPFVGYSLQTKEQKEDILSVYLDEKGKAYKSAGKIDYVSGWYFKAAEYMYKRKTRTAFVSTNSVSQGEQVAGIWKPLYERFGIHIDFAYHSFIWDSESNTKAHVHCVIVGFSCEINNYDRKLFFVDSYCIAKNINPYLVDAVDIFIESRNIPLCEVPQMVYGNKPTDGGFLFLTADEYEVVSKDEPQLLKYIKRVLGASEYINNIVRYCFWLVDANPSDIKRSQFLSKRIEQVRDFRIRSTKEATRKSANCPTLFQEIRQPNKEYIIIPRHSSENRRYIPFGFVSPDYIVNDAVQIIPDASLYHFGVLMSNVHMAWMRAVCGRIKSDYRYSKDVVYNNFPWPNPTDEQKKTIEKTAQGILDARALFPGSSLADLYDPLTMPIQLQKAHNLNNQAVMNAYGFSVKDTSEVACVAKLMEMYQEMTKKL